MEKKGQLAIIILCLTSTVLSNIVNLNCKVYADFSVVLEDFVDNSGIIKRVASKGKRECVLECLSVQRCKAVNFQRVDGTCELIERGLTANVQQKNGWTYLTTNAGARNNGLNCSTLSPCQNNAQCVDTCEDPGYKCICDKMHSGSDCKSVREFASCQEAYVNGFSESGVYKLSGMGYHYCVMTSLGECRGVGWTLILKTKGTSTRFNYAAGYWTTSNTFNHVYALDEGLNVGQEAKYDAYNKMAFTSVCLGFDVSGSRAYVQIDRTASSMLNAINSGYQGTTLGRSKWLSIVPGSQLQPYCNREGFNVLGRAVRIGIAANNENECLSPDSYSGIGIGEIIDWCDLNGTKTGNIHCILKTNIPADGFLLVK